MTYVLNWGVFFEELPGGGEKYWQLIVSGIEWTLAVSACAWVIAIALGSVIGTIRTTNTPWMVHFGNAWVEFFRNIPLLVQMLRKNSTQALRSEEHTSELQSRGHLVCRLLLEKKK